MGGDHHHEMPKVPDYRIYKWENVPELVRVQKALAQKGLKDPWLRNEVWRFKPNSPTPATRFFRFCTQGIKYGFAAFLVTLVIEKALGIDWHDIKGRHHGSHGEKHH